MALTFLSSCFTPEDKLTVGDLTLVDSFYRQEREHLELVLADSCAAIRQAQMGLLVDSIRSERYREIHELIDSYDKE